jgi:hypothetical protein
MSGDRSKYHPSKNIFTRGESASGNNVFYLSPSMAGTPFYNVFMQSISALQKRQTAT